MKKIITIVICAIMLFTLNSCGINQGPQKTTEEQSEKSQIYSYMTEDSSAYYIVDFDQNCIFLFYADESDDTCFALPIEEGDLKSGLVGNISDGYSMIPFSMRFKEENQTDRVIMTMEDAYDVELVEADLEEALAIKEGKTVVELSLTEDSEETDVGDVYTEEGQVIHRGRIVGKENRIDAIIQDIEMGSGQTISYDKAALMEESLDVYSDSSKDIKEAYTNDMIPLK